MSRLDSRFAQLRATGRTGLIPYVVAGHPAPQITVPLLHEMVAAGADVIELGVPFSDPMADGPAIQRAAQSAIANGIGLTDALDMVSTFRRDDAFTPVVLMGYANPIERMGRDAFVERAHDAGVDGVIVVDYPPEECEGFAQLLRAVQIDLIFLLAPTTTDRRMATIAALGSGYLYYVSIKGTTGAGHLDVTAVAQRMPAVRAHSDLPIAVGFGIRDAQSARAVADVADAVVIGSRIIEEIENHAPTEVLAAVSALLAGVRSALDAD